jgi:hypothetical protein
MDGIRGGLGYPGGRSGSMGNEAMAGNIPHGFGGLGYPGGRTGFMSQFDNHAFGATEQATNQAVATTNPLTAINSKIFGRGSVNLPFFGNVGYGTAVGVGAVYLFAAYYNKWPPFKK